MLQLRPGEPLTFRWPNLDGERVDKSSTVVLETPEGSLE